MNSIVIAINSIRRLTREISALGFLFLFPILGGILAIAMVGNAAIPVGVANVPPEGHRVMQAVQNTSRYQVKLVEEQEIHELIESKKIRIGIVLPAAAAENGTAEAKIKLVSNTKGTELMELGGLIASAANSADDAADSSPDSKSNTAVPRMAMGFLTMFILLFTGTGMGMLLEDKKRKTFMRTFSAPLREHEMVLGNLLANLVLGIVQIALFLAATRFILNINWGVPMPAIFLMLVIFLVTAIGLGIGIMGFVRDQQVYAVVNSILVTLTCMLGGSFFDINLMSGAFRKAANLLPQKWVMEAFDKLAAGSSFADIRYNLLILLLFGAVFFTFGVKVLRPSAEDL